MKEILLQLGLTYYDIALLVFCPIGAIIGSIAHAAMLMINPERMPGPGQTKILCSTDALGRFTWLVLRLTLGGILGLVISLYFIGTLKESITTISKLIALSVLIGYAAPKLWIAQERALMKKIDDKIKSILTEQK